ncbi:hypothetical protein JCM10213_008548 [Rhodosporidiobolus nylandii]
MSTRTKLARKAAATASYVDPPEFGELDSATEGDDEGGGSGGRRGGSGGRRGGQRKGKGKAAREDDEVELSSEEDEKPKKRRRKGKGKARGGKRSEDEGKLEVLTTMPVELLVEVFSHLNPSDLLNLSRVNKAYHALLASPGSISLWKKARERFKLPDATAGGGLTEMQYAQLMFGTECQHCGAAKVKYADFFIRQRMCKGCRRDRIVRIDSLKRTHPDLHPLAGECVIPSYHSPSEPKWTTYMPYADLDSLKTISQRLWDLQFAVGEDSADDSDEDPSTPLPSPSPSPQPSPARPRRRDSDGRIDYAELDSEDEDEADVKMSKRVEQFFAKRQKLREAFRKEGDKLHQLERSVHEKLEDEKRQAKAIPWSERKAMLDRADELERRVLNLNLGYKSRDFGSKWYKSPLVMAKEPVTNTVWTQIKPKIIALLNRIRAAEAKEELLAGYQTRQKSLRARYDKLKDALPPNARPFLPLFVDWLVLPSIKPLWQKDNKITDAMWLDSLDAVIEECEEYRLDLVLHAREVIVAATTDPDEEKEGDAADEDDEPDVSDRFFRRATSIVACAFRNCNKSHVSYDSGSYWRRTWTSDSNTVGALVTILEHQHKLHNFDEYLSSRATKKAISGDLSPQFRIHLPLEIACAVSAMLDLARAEDPSTASLEELKRADREGQWEWENSTTKKRFARATEGFMGLLRVIKRETDKANKRKPPHALDPPVIVYHQPPPSYWSRIYPPAASPVAAAQDANLVLDSSDEEGRAGGVARLKWEDSASEGESQQEDSDEEEDSDDE